MATGLVPRCFTSRTTARGALSWADRPRYCKFLSKCFPNTVFSSTVLLQAATLSPENCHLLAHTPTLCLATISIFESKANIQNMLRSNLLLVASLTRTKECFSQKKKYFSKILITDGKILQHQTLWRIMDIKGLSLATNY